MAIFAIGDLHLSADGEKTMEIFGGWEDYQKRIVDNWNRSVKPEDTVVLAGDTSWGMSLEDAMPDFALLDSLPGIKIVLKGNHDYWWSSLTAMYKALESKGIQSIRFLHNNSYYFEGINLCGSRGWMFEKGQPHDQKIIRREAIRMEASIQARENPAAETIMFLHYPPVYAGEEQETFIEVLRKHRITRCYYGHIHGGGHSSAITGLYKGIYFRMIAADYIGFDPVLIHACS